MQNTRNLIWELANPRRTFESEEELQAAAYVIKLLLKLGNATEADEELTHTIVGIAQQLLSRSKLMH